jgi:hypothetical protein
MSSVRSVNIITLSLILVLAGCFGFGSNSEATPGGSSMNGYPAVTVDLMLPTWDCDAGSCTTEVYHAAVHPDGDSMTMGWDTDLDGTVDVPVTVNQGFTQITISETLLATPVEDSLTLRHTMAFIAEDTSGQTTASMLTVYALENYNTGGTGNLVMYTFSSRDAAGVMSSAGGENLVHIEMTQGDSLSWAVVDVKIVVDAGAPLYCVASHQADGTEDCVYTTDGDTSWDVPEEITISEGANVDLCDGTFGGCDVEVTITKIGVGNDSDKIIGVTNAYADANN